MCNVEFFFCVYKESFGRSVHGSVDPAYSIFKRLLVLVSKAVATTTETPLDMESVPRVGQTREQSASTASAVKYDRQIRIWGDHGQSALERASICVVNASATASEILKNLVLPGIFSFTLVDPHPISPTDYSCNFFLPSPPLLSTDAPVSRAFAIASSLSLLNDSVHAAYIPSDIAGIAPSLEAALFFFRQFSAVIVTQVPFCDPNLQIAAAACYQLNVPFFHVRSYGLLASIRLQARELCIQDSRPADPAPDLRVHSLFPQLKQHIESVDLHSLDSTAVSHIPFVTILAKAVELYLQSHPKLPSSRAEKDEFTALVKSLKPKHCPDDAENFSEALRPSNLRLCHHSAAAIPSNLLSILQHTNSDPENPTSFKQALPTLTRYSHPEAVNITRRPRPGSPDAPETGSARIAAENVSFWVLCAAVREFRNRTGEIPVEGTLPDMTADTASYIALQRLYSQKAENDARQVHIIVNEIVDTHNLDCDPDFKTTQAFCRRLRSILVLRTRSTDDETTAASASGFLDAARSEGAFDASATTLASPYYVILRACDLFYRQHARFPGTEPGSREADLSQLCEFVVSVRDDLGVGSTMPDFREQIEETLRYGAVELHNVAAFVGGVAAQEVTKVLTSQFEPIGDTVVFSLSDMTSIAFQA